MTKLWTLAFSLLAAFSADATTCKALLNPEEIKPELMQYEILRDLNLKPTKNLSEFSPKTGVFVTQRDRQGRATEGMIRVLVDNPGAEVEVIGEFNDWGKGERVSLQPDSDPAYKIGRIPGLRHGMQYRLLVDGKQLLDPASLAYSTPELIEKLRGQSESYLNSIFWDIEGVGRYDAKVAKVDLRRSPVMTTEIDIGSLVKKWRYKGQVGPRRKSDSYNFVVESGIIQQLKNWGINSIEFLPINASLDNETWSYRYLTYGLFAIDSSLGTPSEFARMVDAFHQAQIAIVVDIVIGHFPDHGNVDTREISQIGPGSWRKADGHRLFGDIRSEWDTLRYDYENPYIRRFLKDSVLNLIKYGHIDGIRIDNWGGIQTLPGGATFLRELISEIKSYAPHVLVNAEMFGGDNAVTKRLDQGGFGATIHNNGDFFGFIHDYAQKRTDELDMNLLRDILRHPWGWSEMATLNYITNHDEAANGRGHASGAYFATLVNGGGWNYVEGKVRTLSALAMMSGSFYLDMPQLRLLQEGTFYKNPAVEWDNLRLESQRHMSDFLADLSKYYVSNPAFAFYNLHPNVENHTDFTNKVISLERIDTRSGKKVFVVINLGHQEFSDYRFGVDSDAQFKLVLDSDNGKYGGRGWLSKGINGLPLPAEAPALHNKSHSIRIPYLAPYSVVVLEQD